MMNQHTTTADSQVELTDEALEDAQGGTGYIKLGDIKGESKVPAGYDHMSLKVEVDPVEASGGGGAGKVKFERLTVKKYS